MKFYQKYLLPLFKDIVKIAMVGALIFGLGWGLVQLAVWKNQKPVVEAGEGGMIELRAADARILGNGGARLNDYGGKSNIGWWDSAGQWLEWEVNVPRSGRYRLNLEYALPGRLATGFDFVCGESKLPIVVEGSGGWDKWKNIDLGEIQLTRGDRQLVFLKVNDLPREKSVINFVRITLVPGY